MGTPRLQRLWAENGDRFLSVAALLLGALSASYLAYHFWRLLISDDPVAAVDLKYRYNEVSGWFSGQPVYLAIGSAVYPPASYAVLWPLLGWLPLPGARWLFGISAILALVGLSWLCVRESGADTFAERAIATVMPLCLYPTGVTVGNGQLLVHTFPLLAAGLLMATRSKPSWPADSLAAVLIIVGLVKPSVTAPFLWILLFIPDRLRPAVLAAAGYAALTLFAAVFQEADVHRLVGDWLRHAHAGVQHGTAFVIRNQGYTNFVAWLAFLELKKPFDTAVSLASLALLGVWVYRNRRADFWTLMGVTAVVARFWTYHLRYDDLLLLFPMIAFFRIAKGRTLFSGGARAGGLLLATTLLTLVAPGGTNFLPQPWKNIYVFLQVIAWLAGLVFLVRHAHHEHGAATAGRRTRVA